MTLEPIAVACPYCGESFEAVVDASEGDAEYIQDCEICCHPIRFRVFADPAGGIRVETGRDDE